MKANQKIGRFTKLCQEADVPGIIMSSPGIGKTSTEELYADLMGMNFFALIASQYAPDDILGIQSRENGKMKRLAPSWYDDFVELSKNGKPSLLFLDEISGCDEYIQAPLLELVRTKKLGPYKLPDNTFVIAAGNYQDELNNQFKFTAPMISRFLVLNLTPRDVDLNELLDNTFEKIRVSKDEDEIKEYLGLKPTGRFSGDTINVKRTINSNAYFHTSIQNSAETGLISFTSVRSISNIFKFIDKAQENNFVDFETLQIISDSLGEAKNEGNYIKILRNMITTSTSGTSGLNPEAVTANDIKVMSTSELEYYINYQIGLSQVSLSMSIYTAIMARKNEIPTAWDKLVQKMNSR